MRHPSVSAIFFLAAALLGGSVAPALAQEPPPDNIRFPPAPKHEPTIKSVVGEVVDAQNAKIPEAVVYLKNKKTLDVKTRIADQDGKYVFRGLDRDADYEVHAEYNGASSPARTVSSFDNRDEVYLQLQVPSK